MLHQQLEEARARLALENLRDWPIDGMAHTALIREAGNTAITSMPTRHFMWPLHASMMRPSSTADGPLMRAPALGIVLQNIRIG